MEIDRIIEDLQEQIDLYKEINKDLSNHSTHTRQQEALFLTRKDFNTYKKYIDTQPPPRVNDRYKGIKIEIMNI